MRRKKIFQWQNIIIKYNYFFWIFQTLYSHIYFIEMPDISYTTTTWPPSSIWLISEYNWRLSGWKTVIKSRKLTRKNQSMQKNKISSKNFIPLVMVIRFYKFSTQCYSPNTTTNSLDWQLRICILLTHTKKKSHSYDFITMNDYFCLNKSIFSLQGHSLMLFFCLKLCIFV